MHSIGELTGDTYFLILPTTFVLSITYTNSTTAHLLRPLSVAVRQM